MPTGTSHAYIDAAPAHSLVAEADTTSLETLSPLAQRLVGIAATTLALICFSLGLIGSAFDEASAADALLPVEPHTISWAWMMNHVLWFAVANLVVGAGLFTLGGWIASLQRARAEVRRPRWRR
jgi:predicted lysophospholipase L1 biosynthesis ABC-type transport system permease subunit